MLVGSCAGEGCVFVDVVTKTRKSGGGNLLVKGVDLKVLVRLATAVAQGGEGTWPGPEALADDVWVAVQRMIESAGENLRRCW